MMMMMMMIIIKQIALFYTFALSFLLFLSTHSS
jgi:hypothetical protein